MVKKIRLIIVAHGVNDQGNFHQFLLSKLSSYTQLKDTYQVELCYAKAPPFFKDIIFDSSDGTQAIVLPFFIADGVIVTRYISPVVDATIQKGINVTQCPALGSHSMMASITMAAIDSTVTSHRPIALALLGHGTIKSSANSNSLMALAKALLTLSDINECHALFLEQPPYISSWQDKFKSNHVFALPMNLTVGKHINVDMLNQIGIKRDSKKKNNIVQANSIRNYTLNHHTPAGKNLTLLQPWVQLVNVESLIINMVEQSLTPKYNKHNQ